MKKVLVGASGGPDSMYLLNYSFKSRDYFPIAVHVNYHLRKTSNRDQKIVEDFCKKNNIKLYIKNIQREDWKKTPTKNEEASARYLRYEYFLEVSKIEKIDTVLIAHQMDDWLETAIMLDERSKDYLYYGIKKESNYKSLNIYRPLIEQKLFETDINNFLIKNNIKYGYDETNDIETFKRNKIRANLKTSSFKQKQKMIKWFKKVNRSKKKKNKILLKKYKQWEKEKFNWSFYNEQKKENFKKELIYLYLTRQNEFININRNKLDSVLEFLKSPAKNRRYILMENISLTIQDHKLKLIKENENR